MKPSMMKWLLPVSAIVFLSCKKTIDINLNDAAPQIVIEGDVADTAGPYQVQITRTVNFSADNIFPPVSGAIVKITDSTSGQTDSLIETSSGIYTTQALPQGTPGHTYQLYVFANGKTYTALSTMPQAVTLDSVTFQQTNIFGTKNISAVANFQDPPGIADYYTFTEHLNSKLLQNIFFFDDRLSDGRYITQQLFNDSAYLKIGDTLLLQMNCVDKNVYNYFNTLQNATNGNNGQSTSPSNPISNISNNALGYFNAGTVSSIQTIVK